MQPQIQIQEPFKKTWSEPQIIVTQDDILNYENTLIGEKGILQGENADNLKSEANTLSDVRQDGDYEAQKETLIQDRLLDLRNSLLQSQIVNGQFHTPKKHCVNTQHTRDSDLDFQSSTPSAYSLNSNRNVSHQPVSRSLPVSPVCGESPKMTSLPRTPYNRETHFSFLPERLRILEDFRNIPENDEVDYGVRPSQGYCNSPQGSKRCARAWSPGTHTNVDLQYEHRTKITDLPYIRAKRKLNLDDDPYGTPAKRAKSDLSQDAGLRYINQLEMDLMALKHKIHSANPEKTTRLTFCACSEMEKHFMEMATSAYKSVRRYDGTIDSFKQFREELTQTNIVIKDSMELLQNVRSLCQH